MLEKPDKPRADVPLPSAVNPSSPTTDAYEAWLTADKNRLFENSYAYLNHRAMSDTVKGAQQRKILANAAFLAANPVRYKAGFEVDKMKYFVIHRPCEKPAEIRPRDKYTVYSWETLGIIAEFSNQTRDASAHFIIGSGGDLTQMVDLADIAFHCGTDSGGVYNSNSVGVELEGYIGSQVTDAQYATLARLIRTLHKISGFLGSLTAPDFAKYARTRILGHEEIRPGEKTDPGPFNYERLIAMIPKAQVSDKPYKLTFDPRTIIAENLKAIIIAGAGASREGEVARFSANMQDAAASYRVVGSANPVRAEMEAWAANTAQRVSSLLGNKSMMQLEALIRQDSAHPVLDPTVFPPHFNYSTGKWERTV